MVACQLNKLSPTGPAEQDDGGSRPRSVNSYRGTRESRVELAHDDPTWDEIERQRIGRRVERVGG